jgi:peptide/nickel transport system permease protein
VALLLPAKRPQPDPAPLACAVTCYYQRELIGMLHYLVKRLLLAALTVLIVLVIVFVVARAVGDPVTLFAPFDASQAQINALKHQLGFDQPLWRQFLSFVWDSVRGDFGTSFRTGQPALSTVINRLPATVLLSSGGMIFALAVGVPLGIIAAVKRGTASDTLVRLVALAGQALPSFWLGLILILIFAVKLRWLPAGGYGRWQNLILPSITLGAFTAAITMRLLRSALLDVLGADYVRTARAKGLRRRTVLRRHALRNALLPVVTAIGIQLGTLLAGTVIVETIFAWPGMGRLVIQSIESSDYSVVETAVILTSTWIVLLNLLIDVVYMWLDPRVKLGAT